MPAPTRGPASRRSHPLRERRLSCVRPSFGSGTRGKGKYPGELSTRLLGARLGNFSNGGAGHRPIQKIGQVSEAEQLDEIRQFGIRNLEFGMRTRSREFWHAFQIPKSKFPNCQWLLCCTCLSASSMSRSLSSF